MLSDPPNRSGLFWTDVRYMVISRRMRTRPWWWWWSVWLCIVGWSLKRLHQSLLNIITSRSLSAQCHAWGRLGVYMSSGLHHQAPTSYSTMWLCIVWWSLNSIKRLHQSLLNIITSRSMSAQCHAWGRLGVYMSSGLHHQAPTSYSKIIFSSSIVKLKDEFMIYL